MKNLNPSPARRAPVAIASGSNDASPAQELIEKKHVPCQEQSVGEATHVHRQFSA
jgi:hypothetical protein